MNESWLSLTFRRVATVLDRRFGWDRLPLPLGLLTLAGIRENLRRDNLHDPSSATPSPDEGSSVSGRALTSRTADGTCNDLGQVTMGSAGTRFGRNVPLPATFPEAEDALLEPNPRTVSRELLTRETFVPATTLNLLACAWLQFEIRDWFSHGPPRQDDPWRLELSEDDPWPERPMRIAKTDVDATQTETRPPTFTNVESHWWDASQLYGSNEDFQRMVRSGIDGKLRLDDDGLLPFDPAAMEELPGGIDGWWFGLGLLHVLFMREHNAVCDRLKAEYPSWSDDDLFDRARLVVAALIAKIHTVEWTTAILGHPTMQVAMRANWWGVATERISRLVGRLGDGEILSGIPGSPTDHHGAPYSITEEFVAVYRMHPLLPDEFSFRSAADDTVLERGTMAFPDLAGRHAYGELRRIPLTDALYSFGTSHPGAITLHNYPRSLQRLEKLDGTLIDLAAIDILRTRERGVPRYNAFRRLLGLPAAESFEALTDNPVWAEQLRRVYGGDIERVDLMVGMYAEPPPAGFGFSDTAFRIFILMASRRLKSDRFFTTDYTPRVYTQAGLDWVRDNDMGTVLLRHCPGLAPSLRGVRNAFAPWERATRSVEDTAGAASR
ncbi:MAG: heme peroxidase [Actinomycetota bacterium]|nr:heme peroxidase [Actinomycetota bacterium]